MATEPTPAPTPAEMTARSAAITAKNTSTLVGWVLWVPFALIALVAVAWLVSAASDHRSASTGGLAAVEQAYEAAGGAPTFYEALRPQAEAVCGHLKAGMSRDDAVAFTGFTVAQGRPFVDAIADNMC